MSARLALFGFLAGMLVVGWGGACVMLRAATVGENVMPLEAQSFAPLEVITVGTGSAYENPERLGPATGIGSGEQLVLVDAGRGVAEALRYAGIPVWQPTTVFITNLLPINTTGLDDLLLSGWLVGRSEPLRLVGPPGTQEFATALQAAHRRGAAGLGDALALPSEGVRIEAFDVSGGYSETLGDLHISAGELSGGPLSALAWRFEVGEDSVVVSGTGWGPDDLVRFASGVDILVHEAVYVPPPEDIESAGIVADPERLRREAALHTSILDVGDLARRAGVHTLVVTRMRPPPFFDIQVEMIIDDAFSGRLEVAADGDRYTP
ncbi:MAG: hypothetical protein VCB78_12465 [Myxococcota bacterium]